MASGPSTIVLKQVDALFRAGTSVGFTDTELLARFVLRRDDVAEGAFAVLVERHGAMVMRTCYQVLGNRHDAEDAAQAVFLILARRAGSIRRRESLASWLYGVALRVAAKVQRAATRRQAHERKAAEVARDRDRSLEQESPKGADSSDERWALLHQELDRLPERLRAPLVLLHLEGLTQEQAAAQLRLPLGTLQSRSARGRAQLRERLEKRGAGLAMGLLEPGRAAPLPSAPLGESAWAEATVKLAFRFCRGESPRAAAAGASAAALARQALWTMLMARLGVGVVLAFSVLAAIAVAGAVWIHKGREPVFATSAQSTSALPEPERAEFAAAAAAGPPQPPGESVRRTLRGIVRDEQGRPVAKAWVGGGVEPLADLWKSIRPSSRIRKTTVPYRDASGKVVAPGPFGAYFELRDESGRWKPLHPADVRHFDPARDGPRIFFDRDPITVRGVDVDAAAKEPVVKVPFEVRVMKDRWTMQGGAGPRRYFRADSAGRFEYEVTFFPGGLILLQEDPVHFASPDFSRQAVRVVRFDDQEGPADVILRPVRPVRARLIETPDEYPNRYVDASIWATQVADIATYKVDAIAGSGAYWGQPRIRGGKDEGSADGQRWMEAHLLPGRYRLHFEAETMLRLVDIDVPAGEGPVTLPVIRLETLAWVQMLGKPAAEIEATDLGGNSVRLADYRGKVVVLDFWANWDEAKEWIAGVPRMLRMKQHFQNQPVEFLAIHDASITSLAAYREAMSALQKDLEIDPLPFRMLLDRPPAGIGTGPYPARAGERSSGKTSDRYEVLSWPSLFVIDKSGRLVFALALTRPEYTAITSYEIGLDGKLVVQDEDEPQRTEHWEFLTRPGMDALEGKLEELVGLPRLHRTPEESKPGMERVPPHLRDYTQIWREGGLVLKGTVLDTDGRPLEGARVSRAYPRNGRNPPEARTGPKGDFTLSIDPSDVPPWDLDLRVEAPAMAARLFYVQPIADRSVPEAERPLSVDEKAVLSRPLVLGPGATVSGRVVRDGKPAASVRVALSFLQSENPEPHLPDTPEAKTDINGAFRFEHRLPNTEFVIYAPPGGLGRNATMIPHNFHTGKDGTTVDLGELHVQPGRTLAGRVLFSDGETPYQKAVLTAAPECGGEYPVSLDERGRFRIDGLPPGPITVGFHFEGRGFSGDSPLGYRLSARNRCTNPEWLIQMHGRLDHDITDLTILFEPGEAPIRPDVYDESADPTAVADYEDAAAGPITGVPDSRSGVPPILIGPGT